MLDLTFWMNMPSFYQADLFRALVKINGVEIKVNFSNRTPGERLQLGWQDDLDGFKYEFLSQRNPVTDAVKKVRKYRGGIHIVGGLWAGKVQEAILATLLISGSKYFIYSEAPDPRVVVPSLRKRILMSAGKLIAGRARGILAISHFAEEYFRSYGIDNGKIYPFGYFRSFPENFGKLAHQKGGDGIDVVFVGQLVHRKGIDILLSAMEPLFAVRKDLRLRLIGSGESQIQFKDWVEKRNLSSSVIFEGAVDSRMIMDRISQSDLLVLASRWDGWGIVVNEALMAGVPVIVSDMCGAADVIQNGVNGYIFYSEDVEDMRQKLGHFLSHKTLREAMGNEAKLTGDKLNAENAAKYLVDVLVEGHEAKNEDSSRYPWLGNTLDR